MIEKISTILCIGAVSALVIAVWITSIVLAIHLIEVGAGYWIMPYFAGATAVSVFLTALGLWGIEAILVDDDKKEA